MVLHNSEFTTAPIPILFEEHENENFVWMRKDIKEKKDEEDNVSYVCEEVFFKTTADYLSLAGNFDAYYAYGITWMEEEMPTFEDRLNALEEVVLTMIG